ncbi:fermitin family homolog 2-like isoform X3 [Lytechinus variegatus]|uniref:fermitin family homolog 2-like isoform X3 n=2 Tax=Lytechinus variegatus TaxID=7654 RepID=UPI001BB25DAB|nr:fermitin family homolog 2-like isoform X3 [Lytechinus variegatus]
MDFQMMTNPEGYKFTLPDGRYADGTWDLVIYITNLDTSVTISGIEGNLSIGDLMLRTVQAAGVQIDWSDHMVWWEDKKIWLQKTRLTLNNYGVQAGTRLHFTPCHKTLRLQLPDMQLIDRSVNFSKNVVYAVKEVCTELGINHSEELSFLRKPKKSSKQNGKSAGTRKKKERGDRDSMASSNSNEAASIGSMDGIGPTTPTRRPSPGNYRTPGQNGNPGYSSGSNYSGSIENLNTSLVNSPQRPSGEAFEGLIRPSSYREKASINAGWLDSNRSLMEQDVRENDTVMLRFKYYVFYDLPQPNSSDIKHIKEDAVRINQIYEQAKWAILREEIECTHEEMMLFAALQLQVSMQSQKPQQEVDGPSDGVDDIDKALTNLQVSLEGQTVSPGHTDITSVPELSGVLRYLKPKKFTLKGYKKAWFVFRDLHLSYYKSEEERNGQAIQRINLKGCEASPDVSIAAEKFCIKLLSVSPEGTQELILRCDSEDQYAKWMAACRLASKGKSMADSTYQLEVEEIKAFLSMQHSNKDGRAPIIPTDMPEIKPENFVSARVLKKYKAKDIAKSILDAHSGLQSLSLVDAKLKYIKAWQALPEYGITFFVVRTQGSKKDELLGLAYNRMIKMDINTGDLQKTWRYSTMTHWNVNWETRELIIGMEDGEIGVNCLTCDCKIVHEYIGGSIFLALRKQDKNQVKDMAMFAKLTGGSETGVLE